MFNPFPYTHKQTAISQLIFLIFSQLCAKVMPSVVMEASVVDQLLIKTLLCAHVSETVPVLDLDMDQIVMMVSCYKTKLAQLIS